MATGTIDTSVLSDSVRARYQNMYEEQVMAKRVYDMFASPPGPDMNKYIAGSSFIMPFISKMDIETTAISESSDKLPQTLEDATATITPTSRGGALQQSELMRIRNYAENADEEIIKILAENAVESIDLVAQAQALKGNLLLRGTARASLDAGTAGDRFTEAAFSEAETVMYEFRVPTFMDMRGGSWSAAVPPDAYYDLRTSGNVVSIAQYQDKNIIMGDQEIGSIGKFRIVVAPWAKVFGGAGADHGSNADTTLSAATLKLATAATVGSSTNITAGRYLTVGTEETGTTHYETNERIFNSAASTTLAVVGAGSNGGFRHAHASGVAVRNADSVYPVVFGGAGSLVKYWEPTVGEFGQLGGWEATGNLKQWFNAFWKWYGAYGRPVESRIVRGEYSSSLDA